MAKEEKVVEVVETVFVEVDGELKETPISEVDITVKSVVGFSGDKKVYR